MRILFYENRKQDPISWDISTQEAKEKAYLALFKHLDKEWECYSDLAEVDNTKEAILDIQKAYSTRHESIVLYSMREQRKLYALAKKGNAAAAEKLLHLRKDYEYEGFTEIGVQ